MPRSLNIDYGKDMGESVLPPGRGGLPLTQKIRIGGIVQEVPVEQLDDDNGLDTEGLVDDEVLSDHRMTAVGQHDPDGGDFRGKVESGNSIDQAVDEIVQSYADYYHQGWERDPDFVESTILLVEDIYGFGEQEIRLAIKRRISHV